jgi:hypothetical protein
MAVTRVIGTKAVQHGCQLAQADPLCRAPREAQQADHPLLLPDGGCCQHCRHQAGDLLQAFLRGEQPKRNRVHVAAFARHCQRHGAQRHAEHEHDQRDGDPVPRLDEPEPRHLSPVTTSGCASVLNIVL